MRTPRPSLSSGSVSIRCISQFFSGWESPLPVWMRANLRTPESAIRLAEERDDDLLALAPLVQAIGPGVPNSHGTRAVLTFRDGSVEGEVLHRMIFGAHREVVDLRVGRRRLGHRPAGQHTVVFQADVVMQPAGMVFLDDESEAVLTPSGGPPGTGSGVFAGSRMLRYVAKIPAGARRQWGEWVTKIGQSCDHFLVLELPQIRILQFLPGPRCRHPGSVPAAQ